ncbi:ATP-binding domain-containing protein [Actinoplanes rectilineatus]|uniref:ATP-binding domain-containing protein n=1 Tax=Actinoplanes rectilineatus TaxID=113571 RepID=UPI0009FA50A3
MVGGPVQPADDPADKVLEPSVVARVVAAGAQLPYDLPGQVPRQPVSADVHRGGDVPGHAGVVADGLQAPLVRQPAGRVGTLLVVVAGQRTPDHGAHRHVVGLDRDQGRDGGDTDRAELDAETTVVSPENAKGLEFDVTVVVDPTGILKNDDGNRGDRLLYVALTRAMQRLDVIAIALQPAGDSPENSPRRVEGAERAENTETPPPHRGVRGTGHRGRRPAAPGSRPHGRRPHGETRPHRPTSVAACPR